jgi:hypothetical protein
MTRARRAQSARQSARPLRHRPIAAADGRLDQFTGSGPVLKLGVYGQFQLDQGFHRTGFVEFHSFDGLIERDIPPGTPAVDEA